MSAQANAGFKNVKAAQLGSSLPGKLEPSVEDEGIQTDLFTLTLRHLSGAEIQALAAFLKECV